jgi:hypothetical protein
VVPDEPEPTPLQVRKVFTYDADPNEDHDKYVAHDGQAVTVMGPASFDSSMVEVKFDDGWTTAVNKAELRDEECNPNGTPDKMYDMLDPTLKLLQTRLRRLSNPDAFLKVTWMPEHTVDGYERNRLVLLESASLDALAGTHLLLRDSGWSAYVEVMSYDCGKSGFTGRNRLGMRGQERWPMLMYQDLNQKLEAYVTAWEQFVAEQKRRFTLQTGLPTDWRQINGDTNVAEAEDAPELKQAVIDLEQQPFNALDAEARALLNTYLTRPETTDENRRDLIFRLVDLINSLTKEG